LADRLERGSGRLLLPAFVRSQERDRRRKGAVAADAPKRTDANFEFHGPCADGQVVNPIRLGAPVNVFTEQPAMRTNARGRLRDNGEPAWLVRGGLLLVNDLKAVEVEQFGPESPLATFAHERSSLKDECSC